MFFCGLCEIFKENHIEHCGQLFLLIKNFLLVTIQPRRGNSMPVICSQKSSLKIIPRKESQTNEISRDRSIKRFCFMFCPFDQETPFDFQLMLFFYCEDVFSSAILYFLVKSCNIIKIVYVNPFKASVLFFIHPGNIIKSLVFCFQWKYKENVCLKRVNAIQVFWYVDTLKRVHL